MYSQEWLFDITKKNIQNYLFDPQGISFFYKKRVGKLKN
jgi:hypothetical protein